MTTGHSHRARRFHHREQRGLGGQELITRKLMPFCAPCNRTAGFTESAGVAGQPRFRPSPVINDRFKVLPHVCDP